jgi:acyl-CoA synthetase (AMP-forming)/AMP-acid ligase II
MAALDFLVSRAAAVRPGQVAVIDGDVALTWRDLDARVSRAADALRSLGLTAGDRVAAAAYNSLDYLALYYGAARLGAVVCPLNYLCAPDELEYVLADFEPALVVAGDGFEEMVFAAAREGAQWLTFADWAVRVAAGDPAATFPPVDPRSIHVVMYTSGTTGRPKGVCHSHLAHYLDGFGTALGYGLRRDDRYVVHAPSFHGASWDHLKLFFACDGSIVLTPRFDVEAVLSAISRHRVTVLFAVPAVLRRLLEHPTFADHDLTSLRMVLFGGAIGSLDVLGEFAAAVGGRGIAYQQIYGLTEAGPFVTVSPPETVARKPLSVGRALPGTQMDLRDPASGRSCAPGEIGEIVVRGPVIMDGYWRNAEATAAAIVDGWLHTGDLAIRDADGDYQIVDRLKDMVRSGGENVYAAEVERVLMTHPAVSEAAVVGLPDERWDERVVAAVSPAAGATIDPEAVRAHCREHLAAYKVPKQVEVVDDFPRTGLGKIAKSDLRARLLATTQMSITE